MAGQILYDGVDITTVSRKRLRGALTIIPQEAVLFNGTVGSNLDPSGEIPTRRLEQALESCGDIASFRFRGREEEDETDAPRHDNGQIVKNDEEQEQESQPNERTPLLVSDRGKGAVGDAGNKPINRTNTKDNDGSGALTLSTPVLAKGENFSHGQRQVLSLCRALVRESRLMLLDEATASMDYETDRGAQAVLRQELLAADRHGLDHGNNDNRVVRGAGPRTLVTIAHRLRTIVNYDTVVVMGAGRVVEVGSPRELCESRGVFWDMVRHSGEGKDLERLIFAGAVTGEGGIVIEE